MSKVDKKLVLWLILSGIAFISFLLFFTVFLELIYIGCLATSLSTVIIAYLLLWLSEKINFGSDEWSETSKNEKMVKEGGKKKVNLGKDGRKKESSFLDRLKGKKTCDNCGAELEYKEEMDSYYCPECHEYN
mgnify:CR=1 FL=1